MNLDQKDILTLIGRFLRSCWWLYSDGHGSFKKKSASHFKLDETLGIAKTCKNCIQDTFVQYHCILTLLIYCLELYFGCILVRVRVQFYFEGALYLFIYLIDVYIWLIFPHLYVLSVTVLTWWVAPPKMFCNWYRI